MQSDFSSQVIDNLDPAIKNSILLMMSPLNEALLSQRSKDPERISKEFKALTGITSTEDHTKSLFCDIQAKEHNRYSDILPCKSFLPRCPLNGNSW